MIVDLVRHDLAAVSLPGHRGGRPPLPGRGAPRAGPPRLRRVGDAAAGHDVARPVRRELPPGLGERSAQAHGAAGHRRPRAGAAGPVLRRGRLGRRRPRRGRAGRRHPHLLGGARRRTGSGCCGSARVPASRGRATREGEWRETELKAARLVALASGRRPAVWKGVRSWLTSGSGSTARSSPADAPVGERRRPRRDRRGRRLRDGEDRGRRALRGDPAPATARPHHRRARPAGGRPRPDPRGHRRRARPASRSASGACASR